MPATPFKMPFKVRIADFFGIFHKLLILKSLREYFRSLNNVSRTTLAAF